MTESHATLYGGRWKEGGREGGGDWHGDWEEGRRETGILTRPHPHPYSLLYSDGDVSAVGDYRLFLALSSINHMFAREVEEMVKRSEKLKAEIGDQERGGQCWSFR